jgi:hypothetical protein
MPLSTPLHAVVQAVRNALAPVLQTLRTDLSPETFLNQMDRLVGLSVVEGARQALEQVISQRLASGSGIDATTGAGSRTYRIHSAVGLVSVEASPQTPFDTHLLLHGCTRSVREESALLVAQGTAHEAQDVMRMYRVSVPSESTIKRVVAMDGQAMMRLWDTQLPTLLYPVLTQVLDDVDLIHVSADGAHVPMRGAEASAKREHHEARLVTVTLYGQPNDENERVVTLHDANGTPYGECVGFQRPRLATFVFGEMPSLEGPKGDRATTALGWILTCIHALQPSIPVSGCCDGGWWPEQTVDQAVGEANRTNDFYHACEHLRAASQAAFGEGEWGLAWYKRERTKLLTEDGAASRLSDTLMKLADRTDLSAKASDLLRTEAGYFRKRASHMEYAQLLRQGLVIGSGVVEAAVKQLITLRMKRPGATWTEQGGDAVIALRSLRLSGLWDQAWDLYAAAEDKQARRNVA